MTKPVLQTYTFTHFLSKIQKQNKTQANVYAIKIQYLPRLEFV